VSVSYKSNKGIRLT